MLNEIMDAVREAGEIIRTASKEKAVTEKSGHADLVTTYDRSVQCLLEQRLLAQMPEAGFLGEENQGRDAHLSREYCFIVDPIDGTTNFIKGFPHCGISVALAHNGQVTEGVVYDPYLDEMFAASRGGGAFCNGQPIHASECSLEDGIFALGSTPYYRDHAELTFSIARSLFDRCLDMRRTASAALDLCYLAAGRIEAYYECVLYPWDYASGALIAQEAGAIVSDFAGKPLRYDQKCTLAAANRPSYAELREMISRCEAAMEKK